MLKHFSLSIPALLVGLLWSAGVQPGIAAPPETAPAEVTQLLVNIEQAAEAEDVAETLTYYSSDFTSADGFDLDSYEQALEQLWADYDNLDYTIELLSWEGTSRRYVLETLTKITGTRRVPGRQLSLQAEVRSQQVIEAGQIVSQAVLEEDSQLTSGPNPPELIVILPDQVSPGAEYGFDAIVPEPLNGRSLLGVALEEGVTTEDFFKPRPLSLDVLAAGGLFKLGRAPSQTDSLWVSGVVVREDGISVTTHRLPVAAD